MEQKIPFWIAVIININIVIGTAFFLGAQSINLKGGILGPIAWLVCGLFLLPMVAVFATLAKKFPYAGGIYVYSQKTLGNFYGFLTGWGYYVGTLAGNGAVVHAFSEYLQKVEFINPFLQSIGMTGIKFDVFLVVVFALLNLLNVQFLEGVQILFITTKAIPIIALIIGTFLLGDVSNVTNASYTWNGFVGSIPMVFFAYIGIEACCAVADKIKDGKRGAYHVVWISFGIIMTTYVLLQAFILLLQGQVNVNPFLNILPRLTQNQLIIHWGNRIIYSSILLSFLGGFYGMFFYNNWNLYAIAKDGNIIGSQYLTLLNKNRIPWVCVFFQSTIIILFLIFTTGNQYLVTMSDFGIAIAYLFTALASLIVGTGLVGYLGIISCSFLFKLCLDELLSSSVYNIMPFTLVILAGLIAYLVKKFMNQRQSS